jgi:hypothetical protein
MASTEAAVDFITSEDWLRQLGAALGVARRERFPHFEVLLRTHLVSFAAPKFEMVAVRRARPVPSPSANLAKAAVEAPSPQ